MKLLLIAIASLAAASQVAAAEVYTGIGTHGVMVGVGQAFSPEFALRADFASFGNRSHNERENGVDYRGQITYRRIGAFGDWFPFSGGFRFTGGVTFNQMKIDMLAQGNGQSMTIGGRTFVSDPSDQLNVKIEFPKTTPYLGIGYGHQWASGWGFVFDAGASIGKAKVTETHSGLNLGDPTRVSQADINAELDEVRSDSGKVRAIPMIAFGVNYRF